MLGGNTKKCNQCNIIFHTIRTWAQIDSFHYNNQHSSDCHSFAYCYLGNTKKIARIGNEIGMKHRNSVTQIRRELPHKILDVYIENFGVRQQTERDGGSATKCGVYSLKTCSLFGFIGMSWHCLRKVFYVDVIM